MRIASLMVSVAVALSASGCVSVPYNGAETQAQLINHPAVGEVVTAQVGDNLLRKGLMVEEQALVVLQPVDQAMYKIPAGIYKQVGADDKRWYYAIAGSGGAVTWNAFLGDVPRALALNKGESRGELCVVAGLGSSPCYRTSWEQRKVLSAQSQSFQQTLIYSGRVGNKINIGYREFSNDMARPAFNNDVEYDLGQSRTIGYKGAEIEVIEATNSSITYKVIKPFP
jgi:hypothetical protein